ncbi:hypothetical protein DYI26_11940 [Halomonas litopenaei]|nr:hypothetical protein [Halomonas litopenaei]
MKPLSEGVVPIVFVPGVMGSNLEHTEGKGRWLLNNSWTVKGWLFRDPVERRTILDPGNTQVYKDGSISGGLTRRWRGRDGSRIDNDDLMHARGWGEIAKMSYGDFLVWLENTLNAESAALPQLQQSLSRQMAHLLQDSAGVSAGDAADAAGRAAQALSRFHFPVHACGYNWLRSNKVSAEETLAQRVDEIISGYRQAGMRCQRAILVTHSMGGLVARYYSEVHRGRDNLWGIAHGVMPTIGAAVFYRRMKCGTDGDPVIARVLGADAPAMTAVLARAPGPLELLPTPEYGAGWLKIRRDGELVCSLPIAGAPYNDIYLVRDQWWSMLEVELANPDYADEKDPEKARKMLDEAWEQYSSIINDKVKDFHQKTAQKFHPTTYLFYSASDEHPSYGTVAWHGEPYQQRYYPGGGAPVSVQQYRGERLHQETNARG